MVKIWKGGDWRNETSKVIRVGRRKNTALKQEKKGRLGSRKRRKVLR